MAQNCEIELKATVLPEHLDRIKDLPAIKRLGVGRARSSKLVTVYFDTPDHELRRLGLSLRVRKVGGAFVQCVKQTRERLGGILVRTEWEGPVPSQDPVIASIKDKTLRRRIRRATAERLHPVFTTNVQRRSRTLKLDDDSAAMLDIDVGEIVTENSSEPISEFELELKSGVPEQLLDLASEIRKTVPFRLAASSKASRGYALLTQDEPQPRKYVKLKLAKHSTVEQVFTGLMQHCLDHLQANESVVLTTDDVEGVHQMRVALRRLRAALRLFKSSLPENQYNWAVAEAKWLTAELSAARAWDVFADEFVAPMARLHEEDQGFDALVAAVDQARQQSRWRARDAIGTERYTEFLLGLSMRLSSQACRDQPMAERSTGLLNPIRDYCTRLLQKRDQNVRKWGQDITNLSETALHELRLAVKGLRYAVDFFESLYPKKWVKAYRKHLADLQDGLGFLNDVAAADTLLRELGNTNGDQMSPPWTYAAGLTVGWQRHAAIEAKQRLVKDMAAFLRTEPFWRGA